MSIKVIKFKVRHEGEYCLPGTIITGLSEQEEARLVSDGFAECVISKNNEVAEQAPVDNKTGEENFEQEQEQQAVESEASDVTSTEKVENLEIKFNPDEYIEAGQTSNSKKRGKK